MGRKKKRTITEEEVMEPEENTGTAAEENLPPMGSEINSIIQELEEAGGYVILFKKRPDSTKWDRIQKFGASEFSIDAIPEIFGGGDYKVSVYSNEGVHQNTYALSFDPRVKGRLDAEYEKGFSTSRDSSFEMRGILEVMSKQTEQANARFEKLLEILVTKIAGTEQDSEEKLLNKLKIYKEVLGGGTDNRELLVDMFKSGLEIAREAKEGKNDLMSIGEKLLSSLTERMLPAPAEPLKPKEPIPQTVIKKPEDLLVKDQIVQSLPYLVQQAKRNGNPAVYAQMILDNCLDKEIPELKKILEFSDIIQQITFLQPEAAQYIPWFTELIGELKELIVEWMNEGQNVQTPGKSE